MMLLTDQDLTTYLTLLRSKGWTVEEAAPGEQLALAPEIRARYPRIPEAYERWLARVRSCVNADETVWFLCTDDFNRDPADDAIAWNEFEKMELEDRGPGASGEAETRRFWDEHMPFVLAVHSEYQYLGFRVGEKKFGSVIEGWELGLREPTDVARDFDEFVRLHTKALNGDPGDTMLFDYV